MSGIFVQGSLMSILIFIILFSFTVYYIRLGESGTKLPKVRQISAIDGIEEGVGRALEMGLPVHYTPGIASELSGEFMGQTVASLSIMRHVAQLCARVGAKLLISIGGFKPEMISLVDSIVSDAYMQEDAHDKFDRGMIHYFPGDTMRQGSAGMLSREGCACNILIGAFRSDSTWLLEPTKAMGAINIGGTARWFMMYTFVTQCDFILIASEIFAAAASISNDPAMISSIAAEDIGKYVCLAIMILGVIFSLLGIPIVSLLRM